LSSFLPAEERPSWKMLKEAIVTATYYRAGVAPRGLSAGTYIRNLQFPPR
jgi:hypothetical protein